MRTAIVDNPRVGLGTCVGLVKDKEGVVDVQSCWVSPCKAGDAPLMVTGLLTDELRDAVTLVRNVVYELRGKLASYYDREMKSFDVVRRYRTLHVHIENNYRPISKSYYMGAIFISLVSLLLGRRPRTDAVVFGDVNPLGVLSSCWAWTEEEVSLCETMGIRRVVVGVGTMFSSEAQQMMGVVQSDGRPLVETCHVQFVSTTLQYFF